MCRGVILIGCSASPEYDPCNAYPPGPSSPEQFIHLEQSRDLRQDYACLIAALKMTFPLCPDFLDPPGVGIEDLQFMAGHWLKQSTDPDWHDVQQLDLDQDGDIDIVDIMRAAAAWGVCS